MTKQSLTISKIVSNIYHYNMIDNYITSNKFKQVNFIKANKSLSKSKERITSNHISRDFRFFFFKTK